MQKRIAAALFCVLALSGCAVARTPVTGLWYSDVQGGVGATGNQTGNRVGESCAQSILGLAAFGDASIETARRNGGITMISSVDGRAEGILGVWAKYCTVVRGR